MHQQDFTVRRPIGYRPVRRGGLSEREKGAGLKIQDIHDQLAGVYPKVMIEGEMDAGAWSRGMVVGLIKDIPTVKERIDRSMADAEAIIRRPLTGFLDGVDVHKPARAVA